MPSDQVSVSEVSGCSQPTPDKKICENFESPTEDMDDKLKTMCQDNESLHSAYQVVKKLLTDILSEEIFSCSVDSEDNFENKIELDGLTIVTDLLTEIIEASFPKIPEVHPWMDWESLVFEIVPNDEPCEEWTGTIWRNVQVKHCDLLRVSSGTFFDLSSESGGINKSWSTSSGSKNKEFTTYPDTKKNNLATNLQKTKLTDNIKKGIPSNSEQTIDSVRRLQACGINITRSSPKEENKSSSSRSDSGYQTKRLSTEELFNVRRETTSRLQSNGSSFKLPPGISISSSITVKKVPNDVKKTTINDGIESDFSSDASKDETEFMESNLLFSHGKKRKADNKTVEVNNQRIKLSSDVRVGDVCTSSGIKTDAHHEGRRDIGISKENLQSIMLNKSRSEEISQFRVLNETESEETIQVPVSKINSLGSLLTPKRSVDFYSPTETESEETIQVPVSKINSLGSLLTPKRSVDFYSPTETESEETIQVPVSKVNSLGSLLTPKRSVDFYSPTEPLMKKLKTICQDEESLEPAYQIVRELLTDISSFPVESDNNFERENKVDGLTIVKNMVTDPLEGIFPEVPEVHPWMDWEILVPETIPNNEQCEEWNGNAWLTVESKQCDLQTMTSGTFFDLSSEPRGINKSWSSSSGRKRKGFATSSNLEINKLATNLHKTTLPENINKTSTSNSEQTSDTVRRLRACGINITKTPGEENILSTTTPDSGSHSGSDSGSQTRRLSTEELLKMRRETTSRQQSNRPGVKLPPGISISSSMSVRKVSNNLTKRTINDRIESDDSSGTSDDETEFIESNSSLSHGKKRKADNNTDVNNQRIKLSSDVDAACTSSSASRSEEDRQPTEVNVSQAEKSKQSRVVNVIQSEETRQYIENSLATFLILGLLWMRKSQKTRRTFSSDTGLEVVNDDLVTARDGDVGQRITNRDLIILDRSVIRPNRVMRLTRRSLIWRYLNRFPRRRC